MCIHGSSNSLKEFPPGAGDPPPSMTKATDSVSPAASTASTSVSTASSSSTASKKVHSYQNVTCNADTKLFQLEEKKAEATSEAVAKLAVASEAAGVKKESLHDFSATVKKDMVSLQLSGGCLMNTSSPIMIIHHHHHHFYPNQNAEVNSKQPVSKNLFTKWGTLEFTKYF